MKKIHTWDSRCVAPQALFMVVIVEQKKKNRAQDMYTSRAPSLPNPDHVGGGVGGNGR